MVECVEKPLKNLGAMASGILVIPSYIFHSVFVEVGPSGSSLSIKSRFERLRKLVDFVLGAYFLVAVPFPQQAGQLVALAGDCREIVFAQFAPRELDPVTHFLPIAFDLIPIHCRDSSFRGRPRARAWYSKVEIAGA